MSLNRSGRYAAALSTAALLMTGFVGTASAQPQTVSAPLAPHVGTSRDIPTPQEIADAKAHASSAAEAVSRVEKLIEQTSDDQQASFVESMKANDAYTTALLALKDRQDAAALAQSKAKAAKTAAQKSHKDLGNLAANIYKNGGLTPSLSTLMQDTSGTDLLNRAATLDAITASQARTVTTAETAKSVADSLQATADETSRAAAEAAKTAESTKATAEETNQARVEAVASATADRTLLISQLATLRNTTVALETKRVQGLEQQREAERLAAIAAAAARQQAPAAPSTNSASGSSSGGSSNTGTSIPVVAAPAVAAPVTKAPTTSAPALVPAAPAAPTPITPAPAPVVAAPAPAPVVAAPAPAPVVAAPAPAPVAAAPAPAPVVAAPAPAPASSAAQTAINFAMSKVGGPYVWGGNGPVGYDCSGLVHAAFAAAGVNTPRTATDQYWAAPNHIPISQIQPGDLLLFGSGPSFYHVAIYIGGGKVVQALNYQDGIAVTQLSWMSGMQLYGYAARY